MTGLQYTGVYVCAAVRCVPPQDRPTPEEQRTCLPYLVREMQLLPNLRVVLALGQIAFQAALRALAEIAGHRLRAKFGHGEVYCLDQGLPLLVGCYQPQPAQHQHRAAVNGTTGGHAENGEGIERGGACEGELVGRRGFEPLISALRGRCPGPLDERPTTTSAESLAQRDSTPEIYQTTPAL